MPDVARVKRVEIDSVDAIGSIQVQSRGSDSKRVGTAVFLIFRGGSEGGPPSLSERKTLRWHDLRSDTRCWR
ncbi:MAG: hypothetical protein D6812_08505 [Deltaproteobacteria bacterium]|nr:MAG: hypothetical protein D6812_08505 [Deltaproteobacteria bacterium]